MKRHPRKKPKWTVCARLRKTQEIKEGAVSWRLEEQFLENVTVNVRRSREFQSIG